MRHDFAWADVQEYARSRLLGKPGVRVMLAEVLVRTPVCFSFVPETFNRRDEFLLETARGLGFWQDERWTQESVSFVWSLLEAEGSCAMFQRFKPSKEIVAGRPYVGDSVLFESDDDEGAPAHEEWAVVDHASVDEREILRLMMAGDSMGCAPYRSDLVGFIAQWPSSVPRVQPAHWGDRELAQKLLERISHLLIRLYDGAAWLFVHVA